MKKTTTFFICLLFFSSSFVLAQGQDTILYEGFNSDPLNPDIVAIPPSGNDVTWINFDEDGLADDNGRPQEWYQSLGFAAVDSLDTLMVSSSWLVGFVPGNRNWLMTPPIELIDTTGVLSWRSAPFQMPIYMDGYSVLVSTTDNLETSFTDTLAHFAQYVSGCTSGPCVFSSGIMHPNYEPNTVDTLRHTGILTTWTRSLASYAGQTIYIAFLHNSDDDNIIGIDDVLITGTSTVGVSEIESDFQIATFPNPASESVRMNYYLPATSPITVSVYDSNGKLVETVSKGMQMAGNQSLILNVSHLAAGNYNVVLNTLNGSNGTKITVVK